MESLLVQNPLEVIPALGWDPIPGSLLSSLVSSSLLSVPTIPRHQLLASPGQ